MSKSSNPRGIFLDEDFVQSVLKKQKVDQPKGEVKKKPWIINIFEQGSISTQTGGLWAYPGDKSSTYKKLSYWTDLAKKAEKAKINAIFIADILGYIDLYKGPDNFEVPARTGAQFPGIDPSAAVSAMAAVTKNLGFGVTFSTITEQPYHLARRIATLDHLTDGRVGWNVVSSYLNSAAKNLLNGEELPESTKRYSKTEEYIQVVYELLLSSWRTDAVKNDTKERIYADPDLIRKINFEGNFFTVPGPSYTEPSPQNFPVIFQAGSSTSGIEFAAKHAEVVFATAATPEDLKLKVDLIKEIGNSKYGRDRNNIKVITLVQTVIGKTHEEAVEKFKSLTEYVDIEATLALIGGWTGRDYSIYSDEEDLRNVEHPFDRAIVNAFSDGIEGPVTKEKFAKLVGVKGGSSVVLVGTADEVTDELEKWASVSGVDGFNFAYAVFPQSFDDLFELLLPKLRERGLAFDEYPVEGGTLRENLTGKEGQSFVSPDHIAYKYRWTEGTKDEFAEQLEKHKSWISERQGDVNK